MKHLLAALLIALALTSTADAQTFRYPPSATHTGSTAHTDTTAADWTINSDAAAGVAETARLILGASTGTIVRQLALRADSGGGLYLHPILGATATSYNDNTVTLYLGQPTAYPDSTVDADSAILFGGHRSGDPASTIVSATLRFDASAGTAGEMLLTKPLSVSGNLAVTGTVDGRDVAADGANLDDLNDGKQGLSFIATNAVSAGNVTCTSPYRDDTNNATVIRCTAGADNVAVRIGAPFWTPTGATALASVSYYAIFSDVTGNNALKTQVYDDGDGATPCLDESESASASWTEFGSASFGSCNFGANKEQMLTVHATLDTSDTVTVGLPFVDWTR